MTSASLVAEAVAILRAVADAAANPSSVLQLAREIEQALGRVPWRVGIRGDNIVDRTSLFDAMAGGGLLGDRAPDCAPIRLRHANRTGFVALRDQGQAEERLEPRAPPPRERGWIGRIFAWLRRLVSRRPQLPGQPDAFVARLRELASGQVPGVIEIALRVSRGPLARDIEVLELGDANDASQLDAILVVAGTRLYTPDPGRTPIGELPHVTAELPQLLETARELRLAERALDATTGIVAAVDSEDRAAAADFAGRVADLEDLRIADPVGFARTQIERVGKQILPSVTTVMEHAAAHLGADVAQLGREWLTAIERVSTSGELSDAVAKINETSAASVRQIAEDARLLVMGGIGGCVRDLFPEVAAPLRKHGLSEQLVQARSPAPPLPTVPVLRSLASPTAMNVGSAGWFGALFRSLDSRRTDIRGKVEHQVARLEQVAVAGMRDAEPALRAAIEAALADELAAALERQRIWLESAIAAEHAEFALRREKVAARTARVDAARRASQRLRERIAELSARQPHAARAAATGRDDQLCYDG
ncbi:MAG TPA: hypothetical protein VMJ10_20530 [Kofleriaceae bacterium]|nr:hypothetical protein [Kofleriaceae bacterium]